MEASCASCLQVLRDGSILGVLVRSEQESEHPGVGGLERAVLQPSSWLTVSSPSH